MRYLVTLILIIVSIGTTIAQSEGTKPTSVSVKNHATELDKLQQQVESAENAFQNYFNNESALKKKLREQVQEIQSRHEKVKTAYEALVNEQQEQLKACQDTLAVFRFFTNTEETIFADSTLERNGWSKKLTGLYFTQYETISLIRDANHALFEVEKTIETLKLRGESEEDISMAIDYPLKKTISQQLDDIAERDLSFLSPKQYEYYKKQLICFDNIFNTYF